MTERHTIQERVSWRREVGGGADEGKGDQAWKGPGEVGESVCVERDSVETGWTLHPGGFVPKMILLVFSRADRAFRETVCKSNKSTWN